jgi:two-component system, NarL family, response regulator NreC
MSGRFVLPPVEAVVKNNPPEEEEFLDQRERELLAVFALGYNDAETARELGVSIRLVDCHKTNLMNKLGARTRDDLRRAAAAAGLIDPGGRENWQG